IYPTSPLLLHHLPYLLVITPPPPSSTPFPYTPLFRSRRGGRRPGTRRACAAPGRRPRRRPAGGGAPAGSRPAPRRDAEGQVDFRSEEHTPELQSRGHLLCRLLLEKKKIDTA